MSKHPVRYTAFLDILGFKELEEHYGLGYDIVSLIHNHTKTIRENLDFTSVHGKPCCADLKKHTVNISTFSDCIILSADGCDEVFIELLLPIISGIQAELIQFSIINNKQPILLRGGITKNYLFHDEKIVIGKALHDAYFLESKQAKFPRIIIDNTIEKHSRYLLQDGDGKFFLDWITTYVLSILDFFTTTTKELLAHIFRASINLRDIMQDTSTVLEILLKNDNFLKLPKDKQLDFANVIKIIIVSSFNDGIKKDLYIHELCKNPHNYSNKEKQERLNKSRIFENTNSLEDVFMKIMGSEEINNNIIKMSAHLAENNTLPLIENIITYCEQFVLNQNNTLQKKKKNLKHSQLKKKIIIRKEIIKTKNLKEKYEWMWQYMNYSRNWINQS